MRQVIQNAHNESDLDLQSILESLNAEIELDKLDDFLE
jgi:hypothetical protein